MKNADIPAISIILPFFENGPELEYAIQSILNQCFGQFELFLVNNNASAGANQIAVRMAQIDTRIKLLHESRQGIAFALNCGIEQARGEYIARMDADDISHPQRLEKQLGYLRQNPAVSVVSSQTAFHSVIESAQGYKLFVDWQNSIITPEQHALARFKESPIAHPTVMFRRQLIDQYGPYSTAELPEDYELWLRWLNRGVQFYKLPEKLLTWNDHPERLSRKHDNYSKEAFFVTKCRYMAAWLKETLPPDKKVVVCGASKIGRKRGDLLQSLGVEVFGYTDVKERRNRQINFIPIDHLHNPAEWFLINFIGKRGVGEAIKKHFSALGFVEGKDFILGA